MSLSPIHPRITEAQSELGLCLGVRVIFEALTCNIPGSILNGRYSGVDPHTQLHTVRVSRSLPFYVATVTLWHELVHARQCERAGGYWRYMSEWREQLSQAGIHPADPEYFTKYVTIPYEAEAREWEARARKGHLPVLVEDRNDPRCIMSADYATMVVE